MPELNWKHHALIQALLSRGPLAAKDFLEVFEGVTGRNPGANQAVLNDYLLKINRELSYAQFELRGCANQYDGQVYYGVANNVADEMSKLGTKYTAPQIAYYKGIVEAIVQENGGQGIISNLSALNIRLEDQVPTGSPTQPGAQSQGEVLYSIPAAFRYFTMSQKEKTIDELVRDQWLYRSPTGELGLGIKSFLDLRSWFHSNDVPVCEFCNEAGIKVEFCPNQACTIRVHKYCLIKKFTQRKASRVCPGCGSPWPCELPKAEIVENEDSSEVPAPAPAPAAGTGSQRKRRRNHIIDETNNAGPSQPIKKKRQKNHVVEDHNEAESSYASNVTSLRRSTRSASVNMR